MNDQTTPYESPLASHLLDRRRFLGGAAGLVLLTAATACGSGGDSSSSSSGGGSTKSIAFAQPDTSSAVYPLLIAGAKAEAKARGYKLLESRANAKLDAQVAELNTWIGQKIGGIIVLPLDNAAMAPLIKKANTNGVKFLDYSDKALPGTDGWVIFNNLQGAKLVGDYAAKWVNDTLGGKAKVALLTHEVQQTGRDRINGAVKALKAGAPGVEIVARQEGVLSAQVYPVFQSMLQAHPDINVVFCIADDGCLGAEKAFMQTRPSKSRQDEMFMAGWDGSVPVFEKIVSGSVIRATGVLDLVKIGAAAVTATANAIEKKGETEINFPYILADQDNPDAVTKLSETYQAITG